MMARVQKNAVWLDVRTVARSDKSCLSDLGCQIVDWMIVLRRLIIVETSKSC